MRATAVLLTVLFCCMGALQAQDSSRVALVIKTTPSLIFDIDNTATLAVEWPFSNHWSFQQEIGWGNSHINPWQSERNSYPDKENWRFKTQFRYYSKEISNSDTRFYTAVEWFRKESFIEKDQYIGRDCNSIQGTCAYFEQVNIKTRRSVSALQIKFGFQFTTFHRILFDLYLGGGLRSRNITNNLPSADQTQIRSMGFFGFRSLSPSVSGPDPSLTAGFSVGYKIFKKK